ncbi:MAG: Tim44 domain-containing protein, partial [Caldimonas sp.]
MKALLLALMLGIVSLSLAPTSADARRLGGGGFSGMQRSLPARTPPTALPAKPAPAATPAAPGTPAAAAAAAPRRSWLGPIAGLAAGLGIAALMSHLGFGAEFGNIVMLVLLGLVAIVVIRMLLRRFAPTPAMTATSGSPGGMQFAGAAGPWAGRREEPAMSGASPAGSMPTFGAVASAVAPATAATAVPAGFDSAAFERIAKLIFIRMQAANDSADLNDLRGFTTPEMYAAV